MFKKADDNSEHTSPNATKTYSKKNRGKPSVISPSKSQYTDLKNVSHELRQLHSSIDLTTEPDEVTNVTLGTDNEGFIVERAEREFDATKDLIEVLENTLGDEASTTVTTRKRALKVTSKILDIKKIKSIPSTSTPAKNLDTESESEKPLVVKVMKGKKTPKEVINKTWDSLIKGKLDATIGFTEISPVKTRSKTNSKILKELKPTGKSLPKPKVEVKITANGKRIEYQYCQLCDYKTRSNTNFIQHQYIHNVVNKVEVYRCDTCNFTCNNSSALVNHKANHAQSHISYKCQFCEDAFDKKNICLFHTMWHKEIPDLEEHLFCVAYNLQSDQQYYECLQCEYHQEEDTMMKYHILEHQIEKPLNPVVARFKCSHCDYYTKSEEMMVKHNLLHHSEKKTSKKKRGNPAAAIKLQAGRQEDGGGPNLDLHSGRPILTCLICPFATRNPRSLTNHTSLKHKRKAQDPKEAEDPNAEIPQYFCNECPYSTHRKLNMPRHALIHKNKAEIEMFECPHCFFETRHRRSYVRHMKDVHMVII